MPSEISLSALPVRQRGTLEIIDTAMKLYRRYFAVLMGWSALVSLLFVLASSVPFGALLVYPFVASSCACCIAAAVRGQGMKFGQVWEFTKPRYGALLLITLISWLLMAVAVGVAFLAFMLMTVAGAWMLATLNAPDVVSSWLGGIGVVIALAVGSILGVVIFAWIGLVPIVACLEDNNRGSQALGRAFDLMKGSWGRVLGLSTLLTLAVIAALGIVGGSLALFGTGMGAISNNPSTETIIWLSLLFAGFFALFFLFWNPIQTLILGVLYLDLRVRKEALDLEWNSYATAPPAENSAPQTAPPAAAPDSAQMAAQLAASPLENELSAAAMSPTSLAAAGQISPTAVDAAPTAIDAAPTAIDAAPTAIDAAPTAIDAVGVADGMPARPPAPAVAEIAVASPDVQVRPSSPAPAQEFDFSSSFSAGAAADAPAQRDAPPDASESSS